MPTNNTIYTKKIEDYLAFVGVAKRSIKLYRSDIVHYHRWQIDKMKSNSKSILVNQKLIINYKKYLIFNGVPSNTINRRLSTLRHLGRYLIKEGLADHDITKNIRNVPIKIYDKNFSFAKSIAFWSVVVFTLFLLLPALIANNSQSLAVRAEQDMVLTNPHRRHISDIKNIVITLNSNEQITIPISNSDKEIGSTVKCMDLYN